MTILVGTLWFTPFIFSFVAQYESGYTRAIPDSEREEIMPRVATKVAVSIPEDLYRAVEKARKKHGKSRSAIMQDALRHWLRQQAEEVLMREYEAGYRRMPESRREIEAAHAAAVRLLAGVEW